MEMKEGPGSCEVSVKGYSSQVLSCLWRHQQHGQHCDVRLQATDGLIQAHRLVLIATSPYLETRLTEEANQKTISFMDTTRDVLELCIKFLYTGSVCVPEDKLESLVKLGNLLMLQDLTSKCLEYMNHIKVDKEEINQSYDKDSAVNSNTNTLVRDSTTGISRTKNENRKAVKRKSSSRYKVEECKNEKERNGMCDLSDSFQGKIPKLSITLFRKKVAEKPSKKRKTKVKQSEVKINNDACDIYEKEGEEGVAYTNWKKSSSEKSSIIENNISYHVDRLDWTIEQKDILKVSEGNVKSALKEQLHGISDEIDSLNYESDGASSKLYIDDKDATTDTEDKAEAVTNEISETRVQSKEKMKTVKQTFPKQCQSCLEMLPSHKAFVNHMKTHKMTSGEDKKKGRQENWQCPVCDRRLTSAVRLACHQYSKHGMPYDPQFKLYACTFENCKYVTASKHYLQIHTRGRHGNERPHVCEFCGKGFKLPSALVTHLNIHTNSKVFQCGECDLTFNQKGGLTIHVKKHHKGQESWTELCHLCSVKFLHKADLCWHMYTEHQVPVPEQYKVFSCDLCDYQTIRKNKLERHKDAHDDKRDWVCSICRKKFVSKSYLRRHVKYHGEKTCKCTFDGCSYACVDQVGLKKHVRLVHTHKDYKPYVCSLCPYKTGLRGNLDKHIRTVHNLEVVTKHTVHLKMKFKGRMSGDIITKDGKLVQNVAERKGHHGNNQEIEDSDDEPVSDVMSEGRSMPVGMSGEEQVGFTRAEVSRKDGDQGMAQIGSQVTTNQTGLVPSTDTEIPTVPQGTSQMPDLTQHLREFTNSLMYNTTNNGILGTSHFLPTQYGVMPPEGRVPLVPQVTSQPDMFITVDPLNYKSPDFY